MVRENFDVIKLWQFAQKKTRWQLLAVHAWLCYHWHGAATPARYANELEAES
jgi:hypothetical protein